jgi:serine-type D-Ala-D-Ala carboxypeptidase (penicillin-binding protein 5/6)
VNSIRRFFFILIAIVFAAVRSASAAQASIIVDAQTGYVLQEFKSKDKRQIGSLTKIATAMVVLDWAEHKGGDLNQFVNISPAAFTGTLENRVGFRPGDSIALRELLYAALVQSDNVAAYTLGDFVGSQIQGPIAPGEKSKMSAMDVFVTQMNSLAKELKMEKTRFVNPHGVDQNVKPLPYSSAEDLARLTRYALNKASFRFYISQKERVISWRRAGKEQHATLHNTNELLGTNGIDGVKTGTTTRAGQCLVLSSVRDSEVVQDGSGGVKIYPRRIIVVVLGSAGRFDEGAQLVSQGWQLYDQWAAGGRLVDPKKVL